MPDDLHTVDSAPYELPVDIIDDYITIKEDVSDVFNVIDKNHVNYSETLERVSYLVRDHCRKIILFFFQFALFANRFLQYFGHKQDVLSLIF